MPDPYWESVGNQLRADSENRTRAYWTRWHRNKKAEWWRSPKAKHARENKRRWPNGTWPIALLLKALRIPFEREKPLRVLGRWKRETFWQPDFYLPVHRVFIEIDGPEHNRHRDAWRERKILSLPRYSDWRFIRIPSKSVDNIALLKSLLADLIPSNWHGWEDWQATAKQDLPCYSKA